MEIKTEDIRNLLKAEIEKFDLETLNKKKDQVKILDTLITFTN